MTLWLGPPAGKVALCRKTEYEQLFKRPFKLGEAMVQPAESTRHAIRKVTIDPTSPKSCSAQVTHRLDLGDWV